MEVSIYLEFQSSALFAKSTCNSAGVGEMVGPTTQERAVQRMRVIEERKSHAKELLAQVHTPLPKCIYEIIFFEASIYTHRHANASNKCQKRALRANWTPIENTAMKMTNAPGSIEDTGKPTPYKPSFYIPEPKGAFERLQIKLNPVLHHLIHLVLPSL